jgi:hypothetical protein
MMRLIVIILFLPLLADAQSINSDRFLATYELMYSTTDQSNGSDIRLPWINQYDLRTETRDFNPAEQEYTLRLSPASPRVRRAQRQLSNTIEARPDFDYKEMVCDYKQQLYEDWVDLYVLQSRRTLLDSLVAVAIDEQIVYQRMLAIDDFNPQRFLTLTRSLSNYKILLSEIDAEIDLLAGRYELTAILLDFEDMITPSIAATVLQSIPSSQGTSLDQAAAQYERQEVEQEITLELAESREVFDFAQFRYQGPTSDALRERLSIGIGLRINTEGSQALKMQELRKKLTELDLKVKRENSQSRKKSKEEYSQFTSLIGIYESFNSICREEKATMSKIVEAAIANSTATPLLLLSEQSTSLQRRLQALDHIEDILKQYVRVLSEQEVLCGPNARNYLKP